MHRKKTFSIISCSKIYKYHPWRTRKSSALFYLDSLALLWSQVLIIKWWSVLWPRLEFRSRSKWTSSVLDSTKDGTFLHCERSSGSARKLLERYLSGFKQQFKIAKTENLPDYRMNRRKLKEHHKDWIENAMERQKFKRWSCSMIREALMQNFEDIDSIHCSTIWRCLKNEMRYKYKKLQRKPASSLTQGSYRKQLEGGLIQKRISDSNIELIFIDEFTLNTRHHAFRGWCRRGEKDYLKTDNTDFSMSFICGVSSRMVYGFLGSKTTITSSEIILYIKELVNTRAKQENQKDDKFILVSDNAKVHTSEKVKDFIKQTKLRWLGIPAYWPILNPAENL